MFHNPLENKSTNSNKKKGQPITAVPIKRIDYRRIDPSLSAPIVAEKPAEQPQQQVLQGEELQKYLQNQKRLRVKAVEDLVDSHQTTDPETEKLQEAMHDQIIANAAIALSRLPAKKRALVVDLINQLKED